MKKRLWSQQDIDILARMYPDHYAREIADILGRPVRSIYDKARLMGIKSSPEKIVRSGYMSNDNPNTIAHRFSKGHTPFNKGRKMSAETYAKVQHTFFKKGHMTANHREVGSERVNVDGYIEIKVAEPNVWRLKNRVVWEQHNGEIPKGYNIQFRDHNPLNCTIDNLYLISRAEQMGTQNSFIARYPKDLQDVIRLKGVVNRVINKAQRNGK